MEVYILNREEWHYVDGSWTILISVYAKLEDAQRERDRLTEAEGKSSETSGVYFEVVEECVL